MHFESVSYNLESHLQCNIRTTIFFRFYASLNHPELSSLEERLDYLLTKKFDVKARLTEISVNDFIGHGHKCHIVMAVLIIETF